MTKTRNISIYIFIIAISIFIIFSLKNSISFLIVLLSSVAGIFATFLAKEGKWFAFIFDIISYSLYIPICIKEAYKGELFLSFFIIIINIFCLKEWKKNVNNNFVIVKKINNKELSFILFVFGLVLVIYALFLFKINSSFALLNAISTCSFLLSNYFSYKRSILQFYILIIYEIAYASLWGLSAIGGEQGGLLLLIGAIIEFVFDIMAIIKWKKISKLQSSIKCKAHICLK